MPARWKPKVPSHGNGLPRVAPDHRFRPRAGCNRRWGENREIGVAARELIEADLAIPDGCKLTAKETWRGTMLGRGTESVDNADAPARLEGRDEIVEQGVRLCDLVIHVHQDRNVERACWQLRIVRLTLAD